jgi:hypothetical protein
MAALLMLDSGWYVAHRSTLLAGMRIASAAMMLVHAHMDPGGWGRRAPPLCVGRPVYLTCPANAVLCRGEAVVCGFSLHTMQGSIRAAC